MKYTAIYQEPDPNLERIVNKSAYADSILEVLMKITYPRKLYCVFETDSKEVHFAMEFEGEIVLQPFIKPTKILKSIDFQLAEESLIKPIEIKNEIIVDGNLSTV